MFQGSCQGCLRGIEKDKYRNYVGLENVPQRSNGTSTEDLFPPAAAHKELLEKSYFVQFTAAAVSWNAWALRTYGPMPATTAGRLRLVGKLLAAVVACVVVPWLGTTRCACVAIAGIPAAFLCRKLEAELVSCPRPTLQRFLFMGLYYYAIATAVVFAAALLNARKDFCAFSVFPYFLWMVSQLVVMPFFVLFCVSSMVIFVITGCKICGWDDTHLCLIAALTGYRAGGMRGMHMEMHGFGDTARVQAFNVLCQNALASLLFFDAYLVCADCGRHESVYSTMRLTAYMFLLAVLAIIVTLPLAHVYDPLYNKKYCPRFVP